MYSWWSTNSRNMPIFCPCATRFQQTLLLSSLWTPSTASMVCPWQSSLTETESSQVNFGRFTSKFWQSLFRLAGVQLQMSSAYHPQTDRQTERVNRCLETFLRCFIHACPRRWSQWLTAAEFWYNSSTHSAHGRSPFEVLYGYPPRHLGLDLSSVSAPPTVSAWIEERALMHSLLRQHLLRAQQRMKRQADKGRLDRSFDVGDSVFLKLQPYVQSSLAARSS